MARRQQRRERPTPAPFDLGRFMRAAGFRSFPYEEENKTSDVTWLWWDAAFVRFGRRGEDFIYEDIGGWDTLAHAMQTWPHVAIRGIWRTHPCQPGEPIEEPCLVLEGAVPWPTSFDEAFAAMVRWGVLYEHHREDMRQAYEIAPLKALMRRVMRRTSP
jgi:hypothetical protein